MQFLFAIIFSIRARPNLVCQVWLLLRPLRCHCKTWNLWRWYQVGESFSCIFASSDAGHRYIGLLANVTFNNASSKNVSKKNTSSMALEFFKQVKDWMPVSNWHIFCLAVRAWRCGGHLWILQRRLSHVWLLCTRVFNLTFCEKPLNSDPEVFNAAKF